MGKPLKKLGQFLKNNGIDLIGSILSKSPVGAVLDIITDTLGISSDTGKVRSEEDLIALIEADPDAFVKLKEAEMTHKIALQELTIKQDQIYITDVQNARQREVDVVEATKSKDWFIYGLASLLILGFFSVLTILMFVPLPKDSTGAIQMLFGALAMAFGGVISYFFGSSKGSADKTLLMHKNGK